MLGLTRFFAGLSAVALVIALTGCGSDQPTKQAPPTGTSTASPGSNATVPPGYPLDTPKGPDYTKPGAKLALNGTATVGWQPPQATEVGALKISVTAIQQSTFEASFGDWQVSTDIATSTPYFVHASVANVGPMELGGRQVPLYGETSADTLLEPSTFASAFKPCNPSDLPRPFAQGQVSVGCLVFLVPAGQTLAGVTFRPSAKFNPITWRGPVETLAVTPPPAPSTPATPAAPSESASPTDKPTK